jgi:N-acetyl sugar amidotransferase
VVIKKIQNPNEGNGFEKDSENLPVKFGLPQEIKFCKKCVISNQRPSSGSEFHHTKETKKITIDFDESGICSACRVAEKKQAEIDWDERERELKDLCDKHRRTDGRYDCIVPGSGGKDSFYQSHILKTKYDMHPLTVTWAPHIYTDWGWRNMQAWIHAGNDNYLMTPNGRVHRLLTRLALENLFWPFQPFVFGQKSLGPKLAAIFDCPLVFYGENEAEYGNAKEDNSFAQRDRKYFTVENNKNIHLGGVPVNELKSNFGLSNNDLDAYMPISHEELVRKKVEIHYLGYYLKWHPQSCYYYAVEHGGFEASPERTPGTYSKYNGIDDKVDDFHYFTTFIKFGIGRATYDAAQEIRSGDITREEGMALVEKFDGEFPERFADEVFRYMSIPEKEFPVASKNFDQPIMDREYFRLLADKFRSPHLWVYEEDKWKLRHTVWRNRKVCAKQ